MNNGYIYNSYIYRLYIIIYNIRISGWNWENDLTWFSVTGMMIRILCVYIIYYIYVEGEPSPHGRSFQVFPHWQRWNHLGSPASWLLNSWWIRLSSFVHYLSITKDVWHKNPAACRFYSNGPKSSLVKPSSVNVGERGEPPVWSLLAIHIVLGLSPIVWS